MPFTHVTPIYVERNYNMSFSYKLELLDAYEIYCYRLIHLRMLLFTYYSCCFIVYVLIISLLSNQLLSLGSVQMSLIFTVIWFQIQPGKLELENGAQDLRAAAAS